jgi:hypothetical protein
VRGERREGEGGQEGETEVWVWFVGALLWASYYRDGVCTLHGYVCLCGCMLPVVCMSCRWRSVRRRRPRR